MLGKSFFSSRTKNEFGVASCASPSSASESSSSGTNESSAKYAIIAARCVPRSAKNLPRTARMCGSMLRAVDAAQALADLTEISSQIVQAAIVGENGAVLASTFGDDQRAERFVAGVERLLAEADAVRQAQGLPGLTQLEAATLEGSVFVVRDGDRPRLVAAVTRPEPTVGLVFYDLKHCLRSIEHAEPRVPRARADAPA